MLKEEKIRPMAVCFIKHNGKLLSQEGYDKVKNETFYRLLGGGIDFGEKAEEALKREFQEELGTDLENIKYITTSENIFTYEGKRGHEIILVFEGDLGSREIYEKDNIPIQDSKENRKAVWKDISDFKSGKLILYPDGAPELLGN